MVGGRCAEIGQAAAAAGAPAFPFPSVCLFVPSMCGCCLFVPSMCGWEDLPCTPVCCDAGLRCWSRMAWPVVWLLGIELVSLLLQAGTPDEFAALVAACWASEPAERPEMDAVVARLEQVRVLPSLSFRRDLRSGCPVCSCVWWRFDHCLHPSVCCCCCCWGRSVIHSHARRSCCAAV